MSTANDLAYDWPSLDQKDALSGHIRKARRRNQRRDEHETKRGFTSPGRCPVDLHLRTAMSAIYSGISTMKGMDDKDSWNCVYEGLAMLQEIELKLRHARVYKSPADEVKIN